MMEQSELANGATSGVARGYLPGLDGLRAVAVAAVVAFHLGFLRGGFIGVDLFFVISGFLITRLLLAEVAESGRVDLVDFWRRRFRRLLPVLFLVLATTMVVARQWLAPWRLSGLRQDALATLAYVANWRFAVSGQSYFSSAIGPSPLRHTWSLAIEEQFYVLWPLILVALLAGWHRWAKPRGGAANPLRWHRVVGWLAVAVAVASAVAMVVASVRTGDLDAVYYGTHTRVFALAVGSWVGTWWDGWVTGPRSRSIRNRRRARLAHGGDLGLAVLVVLAVTLVENETWSYRGGFQLVAVASALVVAGVCTGRGLTSAALASAPMKWVGRRSYGIYLWSWPAQVLLSSRFELSRIQLAATVTVVSLLLAAVSFTFLETPLRTGRWPRLATPRRVPGFAALSVGAAAVALAAVVLTWEAPGEPEYLAVDDSEALASALAPARVHRPTPSTAVERATPFDPDQPLLVPPDAQSDSSAVDASAEQPLRVVVTGDSAAWTIGEYGMDAVPSLDVSSRAVFTCGLMTTEGAWIGATGGPVAYFDRCNSQPEADRLTVADQPDVVLLWLGAWEVYDHQYRGRAWRVGTQEYAEVIEGLLQKRIDRYRAGGIPTVLPLVACFGVPDGPGDDRMDPPRQEQWRLDWVNERFTAVAARNRGWVRLIEPGEVLCDDDGQAIDELADGSPIRIDGVHFDVTSASWLWQTWLGGQMVAVFD